MSEPWPPRPLEWPAQPLTDGTIALNRMEPQDAPAVAEACNDPEIVRWLPVPSPYTEDDARSFIAAQGTDADEGGGLVFAMRNEGERLAGCIAVHFARCRAYEGEIGYWTAPWARRQGVAARATKLVARYAFDRYEPRRIEILVSAANGPSAGVAERIGARFEGIRRAGIEHRGELQNCRVYSLLRDDVAARNDQR